MLPERPSRSITPAVYVNASFVGRVGALAVALGVGAAVASMPTASGPRWQ
jgi:hypothetical protein